MSLKIFHLIFITAAVILAFGCAVWALVHFFSPAGGAWDLVFCLGSFGVGVGLVLYERYFLRKLKRVGYL